MSQEEYDNIYNEGIPVPEELQKKEIYDYMNDVLNDLTYKCEQKEHIVIMYQTMNDGETLESFKGKFEEYIKGYSHHVNMCNVFNATIP